MPCVYPVSAWRTPAGVISHHAIKNGEFFQHVCGSCVECRMNRAREWAVRLMHEFRFHDDASFITLTYADPHLPFLGTLVPEHFQKFLKRLRRSIGARKIRFFHAGEYGEKYSRPHYHAIIFGLDFRHARYDVQTSPRGDETWSSPMLDRLWKFGSNRVGSVTFESCSYVSRYICKKKTGRNAYLFYEKICEKTGEVIQLVPEYCTMSRRPGIGALHFSKYHNEIYLRDEVISRGFPSKPPKFYDRLLAKQNSVMYEEIKEQRECALSMLPAEGRSPRRLHARDVIKQAQLGQLSRNYEEER